MIVQVSHRDRTVFDQKTSALDQEEEFMRRYALYMVAAACVIAPWLTGAQAQTSPQTPQPAPATTAQSSRPNILVIWGDDIGTWNVGAYTHGMMGRTPHIDSLDRKSTRLPVT